MHKKFLTHKQTLGEAVGNLAVAMSLFWIDSHLHIHQLLTEHLLSARYVPRLWNSK
jgi:glucose uptake protein GlcU